jgi:hypothetical protein
MSHWNLAMEMVFGLVALALVAVAVSVGIGLWLELGDNALRMPKDDE